MSVFKAWSAEHAPRLIGASNPGNWTGNPSDRAGDGVRQPLINTIVNGGNAQQTTQQFPYTVSYLEYILEKNAWFHFCGGSLIAPNKVLTAAHCLNNPSGRPIAIAMGFVDFNNVGDHHQFISISDVAIHPDNPDYSPFVADVAVLTLSVPATINTFVAPIELDTSRNARRRQACTVSGWGATSGTGSGTFVMQTAEIDVIANRRCRTAWYLQTLERRLIKDYNMCTRDGRRGTQRSPCFGDSGSGLICNGRLSAVVSWGSGECDPNIPAVYTKTFSYRQWIRNQL